MKKTAAILALSLILCSTAATGCSLQNSGKSETSAVSEAAASQSESSHSTWTAEEFEHGTVSDDIYVSKYAGLAVTLPKDWRFYSDKELMAQMNLSVDVTDAAAVKAALLKQDTFCDCIMVDDAAGTNVIIAYENLAKETPNPVDYSIDDYIAALDERFAKDLTATHTKLSSTDFILGGAPCKKVVYSTPHNGDELHQFYYFRKIGGFLHMVLITTTDPSGVPDIEEHFSAL